MTDDASQQPPWPAHGGYTAPPPTAAPAAGQYGAAPAGQYGAAPVPYPGYGAHPGYPPGPPPGYAMYPPPYGPPQDPRDRRPAVLTAAAVLGYVNAGLMILAGILLFAGASFVRDFDETSGDTYSSISSELTFDAVLNLIAAGLLLGGAVAMTTRAPAGRVVYSVGAMLVMGLSVYWSQRFDDAGADGVLVYSLLFAAIAIVGLVLAWVPGTTTWFANRRPGRDAPFTAA